MADPTSNPEADVPPYLIWKDVDVLHQRLVREERLKEVGWVKWVCKSYEGSLKKRRRWRVRGVDSAREGRASEGEEERERPLMVEEGGARN